MNSTFRTVYTDILIIGSEGAGARAALEASKYDVKITMISKGLFGKSGVTCMAVYSYCAALGNADARDNPEVHAEDTIKGGYYLNNRKLVRVLARDAPKSVLELESYGVKFEKDGNKIAQKPMPGHTYPRACYFDARTGRHVMDVLKSQVKTRRNINVMEEIIITRLLTMDNDVVGALGLDVRTGDIIVFKAKATILATGGGTQAYLYNTSSFDATGDGYALAFNVGAELLDMEFVQFFPTALAYPKSLRGFTPMSLIRYVLGAVLYNKNGERFMKKYDSERMELTTRDVLSVAIWKEIAQGRGTEHGGVFMDVSHLPKEILEERIKQEWPGQVFQSIDLLELGLDITKGPLEVAPAAHFFMGGVKINEKCETNINGLYAAGEVTGGVHGANRLAGNALAETQVFGTIAGKCAAEYALSTSAKDLDEDQVEYECDRISGILENKGDKRPCSVKRQIQSIMQEHVGVVRDRRALETALKQLDSIKKDLENLRLTSNDRTYNYELKEAIEAYNLWDTSRILVKAALMRNESRGAHYREDFPNRDDKNWLKNIVIRLEDDELKLFIKPIEGS